MEALNPAPLKAKQPSCFERNLDMV